LCPIIGKLFEVAEPQVVFLPIDVPHFHEQRVRLADAGCKDGCDGRGRDGIYISDLMLYELGPFDRVFVTTARRHRLPIVTSRQNDTLVRALKKKAAEKDGASDSAHPFESGGG
jgi:hypothetical protein